MLLPISGAAKAEANKTAGGVKSPETSMTSYYRFFEMKVVPCFGLAFALAAWSEIVGPIWRSPYRLRILAGGALFGANGILRRE